MNSKKTTERVREHYAKTVKVCKICSKIFVFLSIVALCLTFTENLSIANLILLLLCHILIGVNYYTFSRYERLIDRLIPIIDGKHASFSGAPEPKYTIQMPPTRSRREE